MYLGTFSRAVFFTYSLSIYTERHDNITFSELLHL